MLGSLMDLEERAMALEARGFGRKGQKTSFRALSDSRGQAIGRWLLVVICVALILARILRG
jgi:energy-coupling factor transport system permease protein